MKKLSKKEFKELDLLCKEITVLKLKRAEKFGRNWNDKLSGFGRKKRVKSNISINTMNKHLRKIDEVMALKGYTKGQMTGKLKISRNVYYDLGNGYCSNRVDKILENTNWDNI